MAKAYIKGIEVVVYEGGVKEWFKMNMIEVRSV